VPFQSNIVSTYFLSLQAYEIINNFTNFIPMPLRCHSRAILFLPIFFLCKHMKSPRLWRTLQPWKDYSNFDPSKQKGITSFDPFWKDALQGKSPWSPFCIWQATLAAPGTSISNKGVKCTRWMPWYLPDFYLVLNIITLICIVQNNFYYLTLD